LKDKYVSRSVEDSRDRKKKKACRIRENLMIGSISRGAAKAGCETIKTKIEEVCSGETGRGQMPRPNAR
jgi:hypothetical protein